MVLDSWKISGRYANLGGHQVFYKDAGSGKAVLLLHGFVTSSLDWFKVYEPLARKYRVIALDYIGFGFSDKPRNYDYSTKNRALEVAEFLKVLKIKQVHVVACSFSVSVAQEMLCLQKKEVLSFKIASVGLLNGGLLTDSNNPSIPQRLMLSPAGGFFRRTLNLQLN